MSGNETVAQMMRRSAGDGEGFADCVICEWHHGSCMAAEGEGVCGDFKPAAFRALADRIEAEQRAIIDAQDGSAHKIMRAWAEQRGYPWADGESITQWLDRRFLRLPLVDGKPLANGMEIEGLGGPVEMFCVFDDGSGEAYGGGNSVLFHAYHKPDRDSTLHLAKPKVLDADGVPIEVGDTVWLARPEDVTGDSSLRGALKVDRIVRNQVRVEASNGESAWPLPENLTHKEPDTQERIDADARKVIWMYWNCGASVCSECPVLVDGENPTKHHGARDCAEAMRLDLLRRQRELDERLMGGE